MGDESEAGACDCGAERFVQHHDGYYVHHHDTHCGHRTGSGERGAGGVPGYHPVNGGPRPGDAKQPEEQVKGMYFVVDEVGDTLDAVGLTAAAAYGDPHQPKWKECMYPELAHAEEKARKWTKERQQSHGVCKEVSRYTIQPAVINKQEFTS